MLPKGIQAQLIALVLMVLIPASLLVAFIAVQQRRGADASGRAEQRGHGST